MPDLHYVIIARDHSGSPANVPLTGLSPQWVFLSRLADGSSVAFPPITEIGHGQYRIAYDPEARGEASGQIDLGSSVVDPISRYVDVIFYLSDARTSVLLDAPVSDMPPTPNVVFLGADAATQGSWRGVYGSRGSWIALDSSGANPVLPSGTTLSASGGTPFVWASSSTDARVLQKTDSQGRFGSCWYTPNSMTFAIAQTGRKPTRLSIYALDFENANRLMRVEILDASGTVVDTRTLSGFRNGTYLTWSLRGHATLRFTNLQAVTNAVISGIFFD